MSLVPLVSPVSLVSPVGLGGASSPGRVHRHSYLGGDARIQVRYKSVQVSTSQDKSAQVSTSQYKSAQVSTSQYKSCQQNYYFRVCSFHSELLFFNFVKSEM